MEDILINFHYLVKNRLGPYKIVAKHNDGKYWSTMDGTWVQDKSRAHDYEYNPTKGIGMSKWSAFLMTAAGDIALSNKDFK